MSATISTMAKHYKRTAAANAFGALGYISVLFQWAWSLLILCYPLITDRSDLLLPPPGADQSPVVNVSPEMSPLVAIIVIITTVVVMALAVVAIVRLPRNLGKQSSTLTKSAASAVLPAITRHKKISKNQRQKLSHRLVLGIKLSAVLLPLVLLLFVPPTVGLSPLAIWAVGTGAALLSLLYFTVQQFIALFGKVNTVDIW